MRAALLAGLLVLLWGPAYVCAQTVGGESAASTKGAALTASELERQVFGIVYEGDALRFLGYVPEDGVNLGRDAVHASRNEVEKQLTNRIGLYCKLFDSSCLHPAGKSDSPSQVCSYRELLTHSEKVRTASTETTRNHVRQAIVVAEVQNAKCGGHLLIDFIFNYQQGGWKLFSIP